MSREAICVAYHSLGEYSEGGWAYAQEGGIWAVGQDKGSERRLVLCGAADAVKASSGSSVVLTCEVDWAVRMFSDRHYNTWAQNGWKTESMEDGERTSVKHLELWQEIYEISKSKPIFCRPPSAENKSTLIKAYDLATSTTLLDINESGTNFPDDCPYVDEEDHDN